MLERYFYRLLAQYLAVYVRPEDRVLHGNPRDSALMDAMNSKQAALVAKFPETEDNLEASQKLAALREWQPAYIVLDPNLPSAPDLQHVLTQIRYLHVIPALIRKAIEARDTGQDSLEVWGTGTASREFLFVRDAAEAIALAAEHYQDPDPINIGSGQEITIRALAELICDLGGFKGELRWNQAKPDGQPRRCLDTSRARRAFGFQVQTRLRDGLIETLAWYERRQARLTQASTRDTGRLTLAPVRPSPVFVDSGWEVLYEDRP